MSADHCGNSINLASDNSISNGTNQLSQKMDDLKITKNCQVDLKTIISAPSSNLQTSSANVPPEALLRGQITSVPTLSIHKSTATSKNTVDIAIIANIWKEELDNWYKASPVEMKSSVFNSGKLIGKKIKEVREQGTQYFILTGDNFTFKFNVGGSKSLVGKTELTKTRFFAIVHRYLHQAALRESDPESKGFKSSALVGRVEFEQPNPLHKYRFLLGEGFHLNYDMFKGEEEQTLFILGCLLLDFLSCHSKNSLRYNSCKKIENFVEYVESFEAKSGDVLLAAMPIGGFSLNTVNCKMPQLKELASLLTIHPFGTSYCSIQIKKRLASILKEMQEESDNEKELILQPNL